MDRITKTFTLPYKERGKKEEMHKEYEISFIANDVMEDLVELDELMSVYQKMDSTERISNKTYKEYTEKQRKILLQILEDNDCLDIDENFLRRKCQQPDINYFLIQCSLKDMDDVKKKMVMQGLIS